MEDGRVVDIHIEDEMRSSYIDYSMSVIIGRALPDVRDGLKPVHRRILYGMRELGLAPNRPFKKSARVVGDVLGKYHPHGDSAVYDAMVRMVQDFSLRYPLVTGQGNFGSVDGDAAAAMRYTEVRLARIADDLLTDIEKETVDFVPNFDESLDEPSVLPAVLPNLLVNGSSGIAVGMATNIPPHNLSEVADAIEAVIDNPELESTDLLSYVSGPDFPTGGVIYGRKGIYEAYTTGRGRIVVRGRATIEEAPNGRETIIVTEIPFMVNKTTLIEKIALLVREKKIPQISDIRDESDRDGMRIVIELKRDTYGEVVLNLLYKHTQLQSTFGANMIALDGKRPRTMCLREMIGHYIEFRRDVVVRRTQFELQKAEKRAHILEGLKIALDNIDAIIALIRSSSDAESAQNSLMDTFQLSEAQSKAILEMRLQRLTGLEVEKIETELMETLELIADLRDILANEIRVLHIVKTELAEVRERFADARRTDIVEASGDFTVEDLIAEEDMVISISHAGYVKRLPPATYRSQRRGGKGLQGVKTRQEDFPEHIFVATTHSYILLFTDQGRCYWLKVYEIPLAGRTSQGKAIINLIPLESGETIRAYVPVREFYEDTYVVFGTRFGKVKKTALSAFSRPRKAWIRAIAIGDGDQLVGAVLSKPGQHLMIATAKGKAIRFRESDVRAMGRVAAGVRGISLRQEDHAVTLIELPPESYVFTLCQNGFGKITEESQYRTQGRAGMGLINIKCSDRNGDVVAVKDVTPEHELILLSREGTVIRLPIAAMRTIGRSTQGVRMMDLREDDEVIDVAILVPEEIEEAEIEGTEEDKDTPKAETSDLDAPENEADSE